MSKAVKNKWINDNKEKGLFNGSFLVWIFLIHLSVITSTLSKNDGAIYIYLS